MMNAMSLSGADAAFAAAFEAAEQAAQNRILADRRSAVEGIGADVVARLALAPVWTADVLAASGLAPPDTLNRLVEVGLATRSGDRYVVSEQRARAFLPARGADGGTVAHHLGVIADGVRRASGAVEVPAALNRFATLAVGGPPVTVVASRLLEQVNAAPDIAEAVNWIEAAAGLEVAFGRRIVGARLQAGRLVARRRRDDDIARFLDGYFERPAPQSKLEELLDDDRGHGPWAMHVHGVGGVGKTMLVRWLEARFRSDGSAGSVVRVDFDYLHPNYPGSEPGLLVQVLAGELQLFGGSEATSRFDRLDSLVADWHERIDEAERTRPDEVPKIRAERVELVRGAFADAIGHLPRPVVVILDTTEELEKAPGGSANVTATMELLTRLHSLVPSMRAVLSGRRALPLPEGAEALPVGGFDHDEAGRFVAWMGVQRERAAAVVRRVAGDPPMKSLSPFDLSLFASWARDDPSLDATAILAIDDDRYVEHRILGRLGTPDVEAVLPVVVALGRFDQATIGAITSTAGADLDRLAAVLARQEWITTEAGGVLAVDSHLRKRLADYLERHRHVAWDAARTRAAAYLRAYCESAPRTAVTVEHVAGAIRLTDSAGDDLDHWWTRIEERARSEAAFGWLLRITGLLLGAGGGVDSSHRLFAAVRASHAACLTREEPDPTGGYLRLWREVYDHAVPGSRLAARAAAHLADEVDPALRRWARELDEPLGASFVAGLEGFLDTERGLVSTAERLFTAVSERELGPELLAMAALLAGRAHAGAGDREACRRWIEQAVVLAETAVGHQYGNEWTDWPVDDVRARIRLGAAATWWPRFGSPSEASRWLKVAPTVDNVDQDRTASLAALLWLAHGRNEHVSLPAAAGSFPSRVRVHIDVPPLLVARALEKAREGQVDAALAALELLTEVPSAGVQYLVAERARMLLVRRFRLRDVGEGLTTGLADSSAAEDIALLADLDAFDGEKITVPPWRRGSGGSQPHVVHGWWRAVRASDPAALEDAQGWEVPADVGSHSEAADLHRTLDAVELGLLTSAGQDRRVPDVAAWVALHPDAPEAGLRLLLRITALMGYDNEDRTDGAFDRLAGRLGRNLAAEVALDEGDSLALRLPGRAGLLLELAGRWFTSTGDATGQLRARAAAALAAQAAAGGEPGAGQAEVATLRRVFRRVALTFRLPPWEDLLDRPTQAVDAAPRGWQPWVVRCALAAAGAAGGVGDDLIGIVQARFASTGDDGRYLLSPELAAARIPPEVVAVWAVPTDWAVGVQPIVLQIDGTVDATTWITRQAAVAVLRRDTGGHAELDTDPLLPASAHPADSPLAALIADLDPSWPLEFYHTADVGAVSWEAVLEAAAPGVVPSRSVWRRVQRARRRPPSIRNAGPPPVVVAAAFRVPAVEAWSGAEVHLATTLSPVVEVGPWALHLIGQGVETRSGVGFDLAPLQSPTSHVASNQPTAKELVKWYQDPDLVIVQGLENEEAELAPWSREQAAYLRQLGTDFALQGVPAVVVVPGLPAQAALFAVSALAGTLTRRETDLRSPHTLLAAADAVRQVVLAGSPPTRNVEDALGVCLFLSDTLTG
jgi:AAA ATPase-like protein